MTVCLAVSDEDVFACFPPMHELRPHLVADAFVTRVRAQEQAGYRLAYVRAENGVVVAVAGFRIGESLAWGRFLYVDDLVTLSACRSAGYGATLLAWLKEYAGQAGCQQMHLDSGLHREDAHRFYQREGMVITSYHFTENISAS